MKHAKWIGAMVLAVALLIWPETALNAARQAAYSWYIAVAPALFPFMVLMPLLTCTEAMKVYEKLFGWLMRPFFGLPGASAPVVMIGMIAGSPASAHAAVRAAAQSEMRRDTFERLALSVSGLSPAFLISSVGASMLGNVSDGYLLLQTQLITQLLLLLLSRWLVPQNADAFKSDIAALSEAPMRSAVLNVLSVCGYMAMFAVIAAILNRLLRNELVAQAVLCILDLPSGAQDVSTMELAHDARLMLLAGMSGWSGLCIIAQNMSVFSAAGIRWPRFVAFRLLSASLATGLMWVRLQLNSAPNTINLGHPTGILPLAALIACAFAVPIWIYCTFSYFLNKENSAQKSR